MPDPTETYLGHREVLFSLVYNVLGSVADTEDVLQETWLAWAGRDVSTVVHPRAYLVRIAVNAALARRPRFPADPRVLTVSLGGRLQRIDVLQCAGSRNDAGHHRPHQVMFADPAAHLVHGGSKGPAP